MTRIPAGRPQTPTRLRRADGQDQVVVPKGFEAGGGDLDGEGPDDWIEADELRRNHPGSECRTGYKIFQGVQELAPGLQSGQGAGRKEHDSGRTEHDSGRTEHDSGRKEHDSGRKEHDGRSALNYSAEHDGRSALNYSAEHDGRTEHDSDVGGETEGRIRLGIGVEGGSQGGNLPPVRSRVEIGGGSQGGSLPPQQKRDGERPAAVRNSTGRPAWEAFRKRGSGGRLI